jgi:LAO/AO transport system kinase
MNEAENDGLTRLLAGEPAALARAISLVDNEHPVTKDILSAIQPHLGKALVVGFTGPPGAGKSTLVNRFISEMRRQHKHVGVVAVDPSSPITGGAVLGDRIRMGEHTLDPGVFIRSLASRGHLGGLSVSAARIVDLMDAAGRDVIILETVGTGQSEVEMAEIADVRIVVLAPGLGDDVQAIKAGILEIADILVVNKSDLPLAKQTARQLKGMLALRVESERQVPVIETNALDGMGVSVLSEAVVDQQAQKHTSSYRLNSQDRFRRLLAQAAGRLADKLVQQQESANLDAVLEELVNAEINLDTAARRALQILNESP